MRLRCNEIMRAQGHDEPTGQAKITPAYNLPCYHSCLEPAEENEIESIAFYCISTGVFGFPRQRAAETAAKTVQEYYVKTECKIKVVINVFKDVDFEIYRRLMNQDTFRIQQ